MGAQQARLGDFRVQRLGVLLYHPGHRFQPQLRTAARAVSVAVQGRRDAAKGVALAAQIPNLRQRRLARPGSGSKCCPSSESRQPNAMLPTRSP